MTSEQADWRTATTIEELARVWTVDWPEVLRRLKDELAVGWRGLARQLGIDYAHLWRLCRGKQTPGHVSCGRILGLAIQEDVLHKVFYDTAIAGRCRPRFKVDVPLAQGEADVGELLDADIPDGA